MKLEDIVQPHWLEDSSKPILVRQILSHLLYLSTDVNAGFKKTFVFSELYRNVAVDFLALHNVTEDWDLKNAAPYIVRFVMNARYLLLYM